jgi:hypothetical protein
VAWTACDGFVMTASMDLALLEEAVTGKGHRLMSLCVTAEQDFIAHFSEDELSKEKIRIWLAEAWIP